MNRAEYRAAHRAARVLRGQGRILECPIRVRDGWPGIFVSSTGELKGWFGFDRMFQPLNAE